MHFTLLSETQQFERILKEAQRSRAVNAFFQVFPTNKNKQNVLKIVENMAERARKAEGCLSFQVYGPDKRIPNAPKFSIQYNGKPGTTELDLCNSVFAVESWSKQVRLFPLHFFLRFCNVDLLCVA